MQKDRFNITPEIKDAFRLYHAAHGAWGIFHCCLDDQNLKSLPSELDCRTVLEAQLLSLLQQMTPTQRGKISKQC